MPQIVTPWAARPRRISLAARAGTGAEARVVADERRLMEMIANRTDAATRLKAIKHFNAVSAAFTNELLLSAPGWGIDPQTGGLPSAVTFGETDRLTVDVRWRDLVTVQDRRAQTHPFFKLVDLYDAITFKAYKLGEKIEVARVTGEEEIFEAEVFAAALEWIRLWQEWQDLWSVGDGLASMQAKYGVRMAQAVYTMLTAAGLESISYDTTGTDQLQKDVRTINAGIAKIRADLYNRVGPNGQQVKEDVGNVRYYLLFNPSVAGYTERLRRALGARFNLANDTNSAAEADAPIVPLDSYDVPTGGWYLVLPGRKLVVSVFRDLQIYDYADPKVAGVAEGRVGQGAYKGVRGDARQVKKLLTS